MKAMVLAAGLGTRLRPLTLLAAKPVLPVLNRPLLHWTLDRLAEAGVRAAVVNTHHLPGTVRRALGDGRAFGLRLRYSHERRILGTGGGPRAVRAWLGREPFSSSTATCCSTSTSGKWCGATAPPAPAPRSC
jgi:NDP-sugar pyrophosphorylase family protein